MTLLELWNQYWPVILVGLLIGVITGYLVFRPRQRVTLSSDTPVRPHMGVAASPPPPEPARFQGIADEAARATGDVAGEILGTDVSGQLPDGDGAPDNLQSLKGVGPKLAALLEAQGLTRFDQIAALTPGQVEALDAHLGAFKGRLARDRVVEQAHYLARGDTDGYKAMFGAL
jgi:predicted flap endonuclease-1-like 5' DNA nuclease